jgi:hypothetical protein
MIEIYNAKGVLGISRNLKDNATILFPLCNEGKKYEMVGGFDADYCELTCSMYEMVSGKVNSDDNGDLSALKRELFEERAITSETLIRSLPSSLDVYQIRGDEKYAFLVSMFLIHLSNEQQADLSNQFDVKVVSDEYLQQNFDKMNGEYRPLARAALQLLVENNFWKLR